MILLNKADLVEGEEIASLEEVVRRLNPFARVLRTTSSEVALADVLGTGAFDLDEASQAAGWLQVRNMLPCASTLQLGEGRPLDAFIFFPQRQEQL